MSLKNLPYLIILILVVILFVQDAIKDRYFPTKPITITKIDTVWVHDTIVVQGKPKLTKSKADTVWMTIPTYVPDTNYHKLLVQYRTLGNKYFRKNSYTTKFNLGKFGYVSVLDTIVADTLKSSTLRPNLTIPVVTINNETTLPPHRQLYAGGGFGGNANFPINSINLGTIYKDRKDRMYGMMLEYDGHVQYKLNRYWKIKLK